MCLCVLHFLHFGQREGGFSIPLTLGGWVGGRGHVPLGMYSQWWLDQASSVLASPFQGLSRDLLSRGRTAAPVSAISPCLFISPLCFMWYPRLQEGSYHLPDTASSRRLREVHGSLREAAVPGVQGFLSPVKEKSVVLRHRARRADCSCFLVRKKRLHFLQQQTGLQDRHLAR